MKNRCMLISLIALILIIVTGCGRTDTLNDDECYVGTGYKLIQTSGHQISVIPADGHEIDKPRIQPKVVEIAWNERYVIAKQLGLKSAYPDNPNNSYKIPDEEDVSYWILDTKENVLFGGFNLTDFEKKLSEFGINDSLKLTSVNQYLN